MACCLFESSNDGICRGRLRKTKSDRRHFLSPGERTQARASVQPIESHFYKRGCFDYCGRDNEQGH